MNEEKFNQHNDLVMQYMRLAAYNCKDFADLMILLESCAVATMMLLVKLYGLTPRDAANLQEIMLERAMERFTMIVSKYDAND